MTIDIKKHFEKKVMQDYFFIEGIIDIDADYFINKIEEGIKEKDNMSFKTNVKDQMTAYTYFNEDEVFIKLLKEFINYIDDTVELQKYNLVDSWGVKMNSGGRTVEHNHSPGLWSGVLYLNDHEQTLDFTEINQKIKPQKGAFALFSSFLKHEAKRNLTGGVKYGISFNFISS